MECIDSLKEQTFRDFETILVDNGSTDGSADFAEEQYGDFIRIIRIEKNLGYTGGNNVGIRAARGEYIVLLNNDTWVEPTWLEELVKAIGSDPQVGMWASKVYSYYQRDRIEGGGRAHLLGWIEPGPRPVRAGSRPVRKDRRNFFPTRVWGDVSKRSL